MAKLEAVEYESFETIKQIDDRGNEFWYARDLQNVLNYSKWENFSHVIDRAMLACKNSGFYVEDHFPDVRKTIKMPKTAEKQVIDYMGSTELIANLFRISQTEEKLKIDQASTAVEANEIHYKIAEKIRIAMIDMGTTLPENLPTPDKSIQIIEREEIKKLRNSKSKLMLDE